jgi:hypothetical protein
MSSLERSEEYVELLEFSSGNGGLELFAFDSTSTSPWPVLA